MITYKNIRSELENRKLEIRSGNQKTENRKSGSQKLENRNLENRLENQKTENRKSGNQKTENRKSGNQKTENRKSENQKTENLKSGSRKLEKTENLESGSRKLEKTENRRFGNQKTENRKPESRKFEKLKLESRKFEKQKLKLERQKLEKQKLENRKTKKQNLESRKLERQKTENRKSESRKLEEQNLESRKLEEQNLESRKLEEQNLESRKFEKQNLESRKLEKQNLENRKLERQKTENRQAENRKLENVKTGNTCYGKVKRIADIALSGIAVCFLSPLLLGISIAIMLDSKGPVIFRQTRVGIHKSHFEIYKFRTMYADTPKDMPTHLLKNPDAMVTRTGAFLRKYSLDELPQLFNILRGEMSIVGPRPALWNQYDLVAERDKYGANDVMPGLTGWAQINGRDELEIPVKARLDGEYVRRFGLWMDIRCIIGTVSAVAGHKGVVEGGTGKMKEISKETKKQKKKGSSTGGIAAAQCVYEKNKDSLSAEPKKVLITGAGSYIGTAVRQWLSAFGGHYEVTELDMHGGQWKSHDFSKYDTVFHVAGIAHADTGGVSNEQKQLYYEVNRDLAVETAEKARQDGVKQFIYMSSMIVYGESIKPFEKCWRITAMTRPQPANFYGNSKWQGDRGVRELETCDFKVCVLRPPMIYGKGSKGNYQMLAKIAALTPVFPMVKNERSILHIDHLCEFVRLMIENGETGVFFPQDASYADTSSLVSLIAKAHGKKVRLSKALAPCVRLASVMPGRAGRLADKAFGSFCYEMSLSEYKKGNYRIHDLEESIYASECQEG